MKRSVWIKYLLLILCMILLATQLSGCMFLHWSGFFEFIEEDVLPPEPTVFNPIDFKTDQVLVVTVSETNWFVLYDVKNNGVPDTVAKGCGEWFIDGNIYEVEFVAESWDLEQHLYGNLWIKFPDLGYEHEDNVGIPLPIPDSFSYIAKISNDPLDPWLCWCTEDALNFLDKPKFSEERIFVTYRQYRREDSRLEIYEYVCLDESDYYVIPDDLTAQYATEGGSIRFNGRTGEGIWMVDETAIPVIGNIDAGRFTFSLTYNTHDERQGKTILTAEGTKLCDDRAEYRIIDRTEAFGEDTLTLHKSWISPSEEWTAFIATEEDPHKVYRCEKGSFYCSVTDRAGIWTVNGTEIPIRIEFDPLRYEMNVFDTSTDERILNAKGYLQDDHTAVFTEYEGSMFYKNSLGDIVIEKIDSDTGTDAAPDTGTDTDPDTDTGTNTETDTQE